MRLPTPLGLLSAAAALVVPAYAHATIDLSMVFRGQVTSPSIACADKAGAQKCLDVTGSTVRIEMLVHPAKGSTPAYVQYAQFYFTGVPGQPLDFMKVLSYRSGVSTTNAPAALAAGMLSAVRLTDSGGSISIRPSAGLASVLDSSFGGALTYSFSQAHDPFSRLIDFGLTGKGTASASQGVFANTHAGFVLTSLRQKLVAVPEPTSWALMLIGFVALGGALRGRKFARAGKGAASA
jgi:hypothetical protein